MTTSNDLMLQIWMHLQTHNSRGKMAHIFIICLICISTTIYLESYRPLRSSLYWPKYNMRKPTETNCNWTRTFKILFGIYLMTQTNIILTRYILMYSGNLSKGKNCFNENTEKWWIFVSEKQHFDILNWYTCVCTVIMLI